MLIPYLSFIFDAWIYFNEITYQMPDWYWKIIEASLMAISSPSDSEIIFFERFLIRFNFSDVK